MYDIFDCVKAQIYYNPNKKSLAGIKRETGCTHAINGYLFNKKFEPVEWCVVDGKVISTTAKVVGMKMALFDVSNVNSPVQISSVVIGDSRTTSAILTNPKALLFSKEKSLIAIPVNNYSQDFEVTSSNNYETMINNYTKYGKPYNAEGYFVYNINVQDGFKLKGVITHEKTNATYYYSNSKLLRGLYIDNNLYTVSETMIKVNELDSLKAVGELKLKNTENVDSSVREQSNNVINAIEGGM